jgi:glutamate/tyrosine decarboxylase-like PLP-dependent enzyme
VDGGQFGSLGPQLSRAFRALKVWLSLKAHGADAFAHLVRQNVEQARYLTALVEGNERLELLAPTASNVVCFRYTASDLSDEQLNDMNAEILMRVQERGIAVPSHTLLRHKFAIRVAITNHRTRIEDLELFIKEVLSIGVVLTGSDDV